MGCAPFQGMAPLTTPEFTPTSRVITPIEQSGRLRNSARDSEFSLSWPVESGHITQKFRPQRNPSHQGIDIGGARGTPILAAHEGRVIYTGQHFRGYGNMVLLEFNEEWATLYAHLHTIDVREGQWVHRGAKLGGMGRTGRATGVHLHFELIRNKQPIDPLTRLGPPPADIRLRQAQVPR